MLHGRGLYHLREDSPSMWGLPDIGGPPRNSVDNYPRQSAPPIVHSAGPRPQIVWPHQGICYPPPCNQIAVQHQAIPYTIHPVSVVNALQHNNALSRPEYAANYSAMYAAANNSYIPSSAIRHPALIQISPDHLIPNVDANANITPVKDLPQVTQPDINNPPTKVVEHELLDSGLLDLGMMSDESLQHVVSNIVELEDEKAMTGCKEKLKKLPLLNPVGAIGQPLEKSTTSPEFPSIFMNPSVPLSPRKDLTLHTRPKRITNKQGLTGSCVTLKANYFPIINGASMNIYKYRVRFIPQVLPNNPIYRAVLNGCKDALGTFILHECYLFTSKQLIGNACKLFCQHSSKSYLVQLLEEEKINADEKVLVLNGLLANLMKSMKLFQAGMAYFKKEWSVKPSTDKLTGWSMKAGYLPKVVNCDSEILLNVDLVYMVVRPETAFDVYQHIMMRSKNVDEVFKSCIVGHYVVTNYNDRVYCIKGVEFPFCPETVFKFKDGIHTFKEYFAKKYGIVIKQKKQPLLIAYVTSGDVVTKVYLVPELCRMVGLTAEQRKDFFLTRSIYEEVAKTPKMHTLELSKFIKSLNNPECEKAKNILNEWNLSFSSDMVVFKGRHLPAEIAKVGSNAKFHAIKNLFDWTEDWRSCVMLSCVPIKHWAVVVPSSMVKLMERFVTVLQNTCSHLGISLAAPFYIEIESDEINNYCRELKTLFAREKPQIVFCVLGSNREDRYRAIKKMCTVEYGVASQVVIKKSLDFKYDLPIAKRLAVQMNCKVGGTPWSVEVPLRLGMIIGIDICVDSRNKNICFASVVASYNKDFSRFFSATFEFRTKEAEQLSNELCEHVGKAIHRFKAIQHHFPSVIVIYRDGVGNKQLPHVVDREVHLMQKWLNEIYKEQTWHLSFIIVSKHSNTKIMNVTDGTLHTGTVVDTCITRPERYDFYLLSGQTQKRVPLFTHYNVIFDNTCLNPDKLQRLTYKMTHMYFNIKGTVRVPAPLRYASRLVGLVGNVLHHAPHQDLSHVLHFL